ncbi:MAG: M28 family peptidase [Phycisphaerales bacterium JB063]
MTKLRPPYRLALAPLALSGLLLMPGCGSSPSTVAEPPVLSAPTTQARADVFKQIVATLCEDVMEGRDAGTRGIDIARDYLVYQYAKAGLEPGFVVDGKTTYTQEFELAIGRDAAGEIINAPISNIGGILPGVGDLADEVVIIGAHYDHIGYGDIGSRAPRRRGEIHPGADDNASGTAGLVILARHMADFARENPDTPRRTILFTSFAGEERGLHGSRFETENAESWPFALEDISGMINMDMIGRLREDRLIVYTAETGEQWPDWINEANAGLDDPLDVSLETNAPGGSDHTSFIRVGVPAVFFFTGLHAEYHTPDDRPETLNNLGAARVLNVVGAVLERVATDPSRVTFVPPPPRQPRAFIGVTLGESEQPGIVFETVMDGGPAAEAGLIAGDRVVAINGESVEGLRDLRSALRASKPGDEMTLSVVREGEELEVTVELGGR